MRVKVLTIFVFNIVNCHCQFYNNLDTSWNLRSTAPLKSADFWFTDGQRTLHEKLAQPPNNFEAKNVILFLGDGMSLSTVTASRIYEGQKRGIVGERNRLAFEKFPYVGLAKTYCVNMQVPDSACTATAYLSGIKNNFKMLGVSANVSFNDCAGSEWPTNRVNSIAKWALQAGKSAGLVTTTRVTHASPAALYAHTSNRDFECDADVKFYGNDPTQCPDIAKQLIEEDTGSQFKVILGGGVSKFLPKYVRDYYGNLGERLDGRNLIKEWELSKLGSGQVVYNREQLLNLDLVETDYLLGLFNESHLSYNLEHSKTTPKLSEMTATAIRLLAKERNGYFLFIEGGRIDHGHHETKAKLALDETVEFHKAVRRALQLTNSRDTLIVVTADHGHTMTINGYPIIDTNILGLNTDLALDMLPYTTLSYANGPVFGKFFKSTNGTVARTNLRIFKNLGSKDFEYPQAAQLAEESHSGSDVPVYANGPYAHLFTGVYEQSALPHLIGFASCIGPGTTVCNQYTQSFYSDDLQSFH